MAGEPTRSSGDVRRTRRQSMSGVSLLPTQGTVVALSSTSDFPAHGDLRCLLRCRGVSGRRPPSPRCRTLIPLQMQAVINEIPPRNIGLESAEPGGHHRSVGSVARGHHPAGVPLDVPAALPAHRALPGSVRPESFPDLQLRGLSAGRDLQPGFPSLGLCVCEPLPCDQTQCVRRHLPARSQACVIRPAVLGCFCEPLPCEQTLAVRRRLPNRSGCARTDPVRAGASASRCRASRPSQCGGTCPARPGSAPARPGAGMYLRAAASCEPDLQCGGTCPTDSVCVTDPVAERASVEPLPC